jgi:hypothetical protein
MPGRSILVPRQVYTTNSPIFYKDFETVTRSEVDQMNDRISKALLIWSTYRANHGVILFDNIETN